jgi:nucleotide-binding universal stress UspA family protein
VESVAISTPLKLNNILYLTDFSEISAAALPFVTSIARQYASTVYALHILLPDPYVSLTPEMTGVVHEGLAQAANTKMRQIEKRLTGVKHEVLLEPGLAIWPTLRRAIKDNNIDLMVLGTHGRTGIKKLFLGSVAEEVFRRSNVPVLTIGPGLAKDAPTVSGFHTVLFATDFTPASGMAAPYAISIAQQSQAHLVLLHVIRQLKHQGTASELSVADAIHHLHEAIPEEAEFRFRPEPAVEYGDPAEVILATADRCHADLIVLGLRRRDHLGVATHLERTTAHHVVAHAVCPVLTVRGAEM